LFLKKVYKRLQKNDFRRLRVLSQKMK
jgi:hypothetical protein